jgi:hypothetical protein
VGLVDLVGDVRCSLPLKPSDTTHQRWLTPLLVRPLWGRTGSTLLMQLLGTSEVIVFDRVYPFEHRYLAHLLHYMKTLGQAVAPGNPTCQRWMTDASTLWWVDPASFRLPPCAEASPLAARWVDRQTLHCALVRAMWGAFSASFGQRAEALYYAEKYGGYVELLAADGIYVRFIDLIRDPRDVWASVMAFDAKRGFYGFGRLAEESRETYLEVYIAAVKRRLQAMVSPTPEADQLRVKYEDLVANLEGEADRIGRWLGVQLDHGQVLRQREQFAHHFTAQSAQASVGRWRCDLPRAEVSAIEYALGSELVGLGYSE